LINQVEERYRPYVYEGFGEGIPTAKNWQFKGFIDHRISLIYWVKGEYKIAFYKGLGRGFYWRHMMDFGLNRYKAIIEREVEDKYIPYVDEGLKSPF